MRWAGVVLVALLWALTPSAASAHGVLLSSSPSQGQRLEVLPEVAVLTFTDEQVLAQVIVTGPEGQAIAVSEPVIEGTVVTQALERGGVGQYTLAYRSTAQDGHVLSGQVGFAVGEVAVESAAPALDSDVVDVSDEPAAGATEATPVATSYDVPVRDVVVPLSLLLVAGLLWFGAQRSSGPLTRSRPPG